tara:strand:+ start:94 stop:471 length:378 start_codon:yes stop_codon:yes gene_type:complete
MNLFLLFQVVMGGVLGVISRMLISDYINRNFSLTFPIGILTINILGSFIIGLIMGGMYLKVNLGDIKFLPFLVTGFLGRFTTFSSFSLETLYLFQEGRLTQAISYVAFTMIGCLVGVYIGAVLVR